MSSSDSAVWLFPTNRRRVHSINRGQKSLLVLFDRLSFFLSLGFPSSFLTRFPRTATTAPAYHGLFLAPPRSFREDASTFYLTIARCIRAHSICKMSAFLSYAPSPVPERFSTELNLRQNLVYASLYPRNQSRSQRRKKCRTYRMANRVSNELFFEKPTSIAFPTTAFFEASRSFDPYIAYRATDILPFHIFCLPATLTYSKLLRSSRDLQLF